MTITLSPEIEAGLLAQAEAEGLSLDQFVGRKLAKLAHTSPTPALAGSPTSVSADDWETGLENWLDSFPQHPLLSEEAVRRENWYPDRW